MSNKLKVDIEADSTGVKKGVGEATQSIKSLGNALQTAMGLGIHSLLSNFIGGLKTVAKEAVKVHARFERMEFTLQKLMGSKIGGSELMQQLREFSVKTPFTPEDVFNASKMLMAFGISAGDQIKTIKMLGDQASVSGKSLSELAFIYGKIFSRGRAQAREMNMLIGAKVPIVREVAKVMGVEETAIAKLTEQGKVSFDVIKKAMENLTGPTGQFFNMTEESAKLLEGRWSTLVGTIADTGDQFAKIFSPEIKSALEMFIKRAEDLKEALQGIAMIKAEKGSIWARFGGGGIVGDAFSDRQKINEDAARQAIEEARKKLTPAQIKAQQEAMRALQREKKEALNKKSPIRLLEDIEQDAAARIPSFSGEAAAGAFRGMATLGTIPEQQLQELVRIKALLEEIKNNPAKAGVMAINKVGELAGIKLGAGR